MIEKLANALVGNVMISDYYVGNPCKIGKVVGRIVEECEEGSKGIMNGKEMHSIVLFATPHGSIIQTGISHLEDLTEEDEVLLQKYEDAAKADNIWYGNKLKNTEYDYNG